MGGKKQVEDDTGRRVSKREFVSRVSKRSGLTVETTNAAYEALLAEIVETIGAGNSLTLPGFGRFYGQKHKGHPVRFASDDVSNVMPDYSVLKFSATREVNRSLGKSCEEDAD